VEKTPELEAAKTIGKLIARLIEDGSTLQIGTGTTSEALFIALADKNDLGIHTQYVTDDIMHLYARGVITNRKKGFNDGKLVASAAIGSENLYEFLNDNPAVEFHPSDYVNATDIIARHQRMVAMNVAMAVDLTGQVAADALPNNYFSGVTDMLDFMRGADQSQGGKSILLLPSTTVQTQKSRIVPLLADTAVVIPRGDVHYVATEYGVVNLFGKNLQERAMALISIAHPDFRDQLFHQARQLGLVGREKKIAESMQGVYPLKLEEIVDLDGEQVTIRPAKPVDTRRIQEHFYNLDEKDVVSRFFHEKTRFEREEAESLSQIDYIKVLTLVAVVGEFGFGRVVGVGEYVLDQEKNVAEVAFSVSRDFQGKGLGKMLMHKLCAAARENGIAGLVAYTAPRNQGMIRLFGTLPYKVETFYDGEVLRLSCRFDELDKPE